jgi:hypothetical protein
MNRSPFSSLRLRDKGRKKQSGLILEALRDVGYGDGSDGPTAEENDLRRGSLDRVASPLSARSSRRPSQLIGMFSPPDSHITSSPLRNDTLDQQDVNEERLLTSIERYQKENERNCPGGSLSMRKNDLKRKASEVFGTPTKTMMTAIQSSTMQVES